MKQLKLIAALVAVILVVIVICQNTTPVATRLLFVTVTMPNALLIGVSLLLGVAIGMVGAWALLGRKKPVTPAGAPEQTDKTR